MKGVHDNDIWKTLGRAWALDGKSGGMVRALTGKRDERGRFCKGD